MVNCCYGQGGNWVAVVGVYLSAIVSHNAYLAITPIKMI